MKKLCHPVATFMLAAVLIIGGISVPHAAADFDVYTTPGEHSIAGRQWRTWCEPYSQTARCRTEIQATTVVRAGSTYQQRRGWTFNNLTYVSSPSPLWTGNPLATTGDHVIDGRTWRTECRTPKTGNGCRSYLLADVVAAVETSAGWRYRTERKFVFNNIVQYGQLRTDLAELTKWHPSTTPPAETPPVKAPPVETPPVETPPVETPVETPDPALPPQVNYNNRKGPNNTDRVTLTYDDCPNSLSAFKATVRAGEELGIALALFPRGDCIAKGNFEPDFARAHGHYVFNHSISHPSLPQLSFDEVVKELGAPGVVTTYGRPPFGASSPTVKRAYDAVGMRQWFWNVDTNDWRDKTQEEVVDYVVENTRAGNSVLMHMQWRAFNGDALREMKSGLAARGISVCRNRGVPTAVKPEKMDC